MATGEARFEAMRDLSAEDFGLAMKQSEQAVDSVLNLVSTRLGLDHDRVLLGRYGIPAMVRFVVESGGSVSDTATQNRLFFWYIQQAMWGRYSNSTESTLDHDLAVLEESGLDGLIADLELTRGTLRVRPEDFDTHTVGSRFHPILYMLTHVNDALDIGLWNWVTAVAAPSRQGLQPGGAPRVPKGAAVRRGLRTPAGQRRGQLCAPDERFQQDAGQTATE